MQAEAGTEAAPLEVADALVEEPAFTSEELQALAAPIALYPDPLLLQVLIAATYPLDVVRADRLLGGNPDVSPEELVELAEAEGWDPSVISLVPFPTVLERMATELDWTENLADAMILQPEDLLDAIQDLREQAQAAGALESNEYQSVSFDEDDAISIMPADQETVYVPIYDTEKVYASQPVTTVVSSSGYSSESMVATGLISFTVGVIVGNYFGRRDKYDYYWGTPYRPVIWHQHRVYPPYYRPGTYRPPYYRPLPPNYRPGDAWRPQPELYRGAKTRVEAKREINRNINIKRDINVGTGRQPRVGDRPATLEKALRDRGRDLPGVPRAQAPKRPTTLNEVRPGIGDKTTPAVRPAAGSTVFRDAGGGIDARKARDRGEISVDRSKRPQAPQAKVPSVAPVRAPEVNRKLVQQRPQASQGSGSSRAPALRVQPGGRAQVTSERGRASLQRTR